MGLIAQEVFLITHDPLPPRTRKRGLVGVPVCNQVTVMSEVGAVCAAGEVGEIAVRGPMVFDGYLDDPEATAAAFVDGWFRTGDLGRFDEDGYLYLAGRIKELINRGGEKISPVEIDAAIEAIPGVRAAATFAIPHRSLGEEVAAAVVRDGNVAIEASDIIDQVRRRMGPKRIPRQIYFVDQLPRTDSGKVRRSELTRLLGLVQPDATSAGGRRGGEPGAIASPLEAALAGLWASVLQVSSVGPDDDFFVLGGDSLRGFTAARQRQSGVRCTAPAAGAVPGCRERRRHGASDRGGALKMSDGGVSSNSSAVRDRHPGALIFSTSFPQDWAVLFCLSWRLAVVLRTRIAKA